MMTRYLGPFMMKRGVRSAQRAESGQTIGSFCALRAAHCALASPLPPHPIEHPGLQHLAGVGAADDGAAHLFVVRVRERLGDASLVGDHLVDLLSERARGVVALQ